MLCQIRVFPTEHQTRTDCLLPHRTGSPLTELGALLFHFLDTLGEDFGIGVLWAVLVIFREGGVGTGMGEGEHTAASLTRSA